MFLISQDYYLFADFRDALFTFNFVKLNYAFQTNVKANSFN